MTLQCGFVNLALLTVDLKSWPALGITLANLIDVKTTSSLATLKPP